MWTLSVKKRAGQHGGRVNTVNTRAALHLILPGSDSLSSPLPSPRLLCTSSLLHDLTNSTAQEKLWVSVTCTQWSQKTTHPAFLSLWPVQPDILYSGSQRENYKPRVASRFACHHKRMLCSKGVLPLFQIHAKMQSLQGAEHAVPTFDEKSQIIHKTSTIFPYDETVQL